MILEKGDSKIATSRVLDAQGAQEIEKATNVINQFTKLLSQEMAHLENKIVLSSGDVVMRDLDGEFVEKNKTIEVTIPPVITPVSFTDGDTITPVNYAEQKRAVTLDVMYTADLAFSSDDLTQALERGYSPQIRSCVVGLRQIIDTYMAGIIYKGAYAYGGTSGTTPDGMDDIAGAELLLNLNKAPEENRHFVVDATAKSKLIQLDSFKNFSASGSTEGLRKSSMGEKYGFNMLSTNNIPTHTAGGYTALADVTGTVVVSNNSTMTDGTPYSSIVLTSSAGTSTATLLVGDLMTFENEAGVDQKAIVLETTASAISGVVTAKISPAQTGATTANAVTFPDVTARSSVRNLAIQKGAVVLASRPLTPYPDKTSISISTPEGIPLRLTFDSNTLAKTTYISVDCLIKGVVVRPELLATWLG